MPNLGRKSPEDPISALLTSWDAGFELVPSDLIALKQHSNTQQPLHQLPVEILAEIFWGSLLPVWEVKNYFASLYHLIGVCTWWAEILKATPHFWSFFCAGGSANHLATIRIRSRGFLSMAGLTIETTNKGIFTGRSTQSFTELGTKWKSVDMSIAERWWDLDYREFEGAPEHSGIPCSHLHWPTVEEISLKVYGPVPAFDLSQILDVWMPNARHLRLVEWPFKCQPTTLRGLQSLSLVVSMEAQNAADALQPELLYAALQSAPQLQVLKLSNTYTSLGEDPVVLEPIDLPELLSLIWVNGKAVDQQAFLSTIKMPRCSTMLLHSNVDRFRGEFYFPFSNSLSPHQDDGNSQQGVGTLKRFLDQAVEVNILVHYGARRTSFRFTTLSVDRSKGLDVQRSVDVSHGFDASEGLEWVVDLFQEQLLKTPVHLKVAGLRSKGIWLGRIAELPLIVSITFHDIRMDTPHPLLEFLGQWRYDQASNKFWWPFPNLRSLIIRSSCSITSLRLPSIIADRYSLTQTCLPKSFTSKYRPLGKYIVVRPARLTSVDILYRASEKRAVKYDKMVGLKIDQRLGPGTFSQHLCSDEDRYNLYRTGDLDWAQFEDEPEDIWNEVIHEGCSSDWEGDDEAPEEVLGT